MNTLNEWNYSEDGRFISSTKQITHHTDLLSIHNEKALDRNTEAIKEQTKMQEEVITTQTKTQHIDSVDMREQQRVDAEMGRTNQTTLFGNLIKTLKKLFGSKDYDEDNGSGESFYEMVQRENNESQALMEAGNTNSGNAVTELGTIVEKLTDVTNAIAADMNADNTNSAAIKGAINNLESAIRNLQLVANVTVEDNRP